MIYTKLNFIREGTIDNLLVVKCWFFIKNNQQTTNTQLDLTFTAPGNYICIGVVVPHLAP
ncbi:hypothetical protein CEN44_07230 [Fischerella muscicola CCMEE 5323]|uniref:Uncharacterized protein n=1 Tax=Fischerella muscicola CCMEE 5323 TaxID=2019572 RepID=A0A2N6K609_FISMU|nr:hypothetical protein CEN44_07230 [Fischerella muscicola CCMEE 5323]